MEKSSQQAKTSALPKASIDQPLPSAEQRLAVDPESPLAMLPDDFFQPGAGTIASLLLMTGEKPLNETEQKPNKIKKLTGLNNSKPQPKSALSQAKLNFEANKAS